ncbi:6-bladed beta-propeller [Bacteroides thetaiotaomicron]|uniref:6-bladed beta-propeller n=1 Tax=Bacteroides thetaiotaomicron TaxID=818 RepID=UPI0021652031|nr:6-bladed beta-propeller [Bacteroides thetaiotaomicron]MCS2712082.1 6-bladed beta-propeller [Bacteroides thetaiotaomicron]MCS2783143.1 6-bladed beta-propeller [Bacteroides thetaiotaomicron]
MKNIHIIWIVLSLMMIGCKKNVSLENGDVIMIDVAKDGYSQKEIILQDFMDVEYIALDSSDDFLCQGQVLAVGAKIIVVRNDIQDGDIYLFDRKKELASEKSIVKGMGMRNIQSHIMLYWMKTMRNCLLMMSCKIK